MQTRRPDQSPLSPSRWIDCIMQSTIPLYCNDPSGSFFCFWSLTLALSNGSEQKAVREPDTADDTSTVHLLFPRKGRRRSLLSSKLTIITTFRREHRTMLGVTPLKRPRTPSSFTVVTTASIAFRQLLRNSLGRPLSAQSLTYARSKGLHAIAPRKPVIPEHIVFSDMDNFELFGSFCDRMSSLIQQNAPILTGLKTAQRRHPASTPRQKAEIPPSLAYILRNTLLMDLTSIASDCICMRTFTLSRGWQTACPTTPAANVMGRLMAAGGIWMAGFGPSLMPISFI